MQNFDLNDLIQAIKLKIAKQQQKKRDYSDENDEETYEGKFRF